MAVLPKKSFSLVLLILYFANKIVKISDAWKYQDLQSGEANKNKTVKGLYPDFENGEEFPKWGGICDSGGRQSPIALSKKLATEGIFSRITYKNYDKPLQHPRIENNGRTVEVTFDGSEISVEGGGLLYEYVLYQFHFHWEAEHAINNQRFALEMHLVHRNKAYESKEEAEKHSNGFAIFAILFHLGNKVNPHISKILQHIEEIAPSDKVGHKVDILGEIILKNFLPRNPSLYYYFYEGSFTIPKCTQSVAWHIFSKTNEITSTQVEQFKRIEREDGKKLKNNYRNLQNSTLQIIYVTQNEADITYHCFHWNTYGLIILYIIYNIVMK